MNTLAEFTLSRRKELGLTQVVVANHVRVTATYISDIELGKRYPMVRKILERLSEVLKCSFDDLFDRAAKAHLK